MARLKNDAYYTPVGSLGPALELAGFPKGLRALEPSAGDGRLVSELDSLGYGVLSNDICRERIRDFRFDLSHEGNWRAIRSLTPGFEAVIGNPPYSLAPEFVRYPLLVGYRYVFYLLRLSWLERCLNRADLIDSGKLRAVVVTPRLSFTGDGWKDRTTTAWFWFDREHNGDPVVRWLK